MNTIRTLRFDPVDLIQEPIMRFRLHYEGQLLSSSGEARGGQVDRRAGHKDEIRLAFHRQLQHFWQIHPWLSIAGMPWNIFGKDERFREDQLNGKRTSLTEGLAELHEVCGKKFVPLVCDRLSLLCGVKLLVLRRDKPGGIINARDLDNRLKTIFDALRMPKNGAEFSSEHYEEATYVLLQDDSLISSVVIETDDLLDPPSKAGGDDSYVRLLVEVEIRPYADMNGFTQMFRAD